MYIFTRKDTSARIFDTQSGLRYQISWLASAVKSNPAIILDIDSAHLGASETVYPLSYRNREAFDFWVQLEQKTERYPMYSIRKELAEALEYWEKATTEEQND